MEGLKNLLKKYNNIFSIIGIIGHGIYSLFIIGFLVFTINNLSTSTSNLATNLGLWFEAITDGLKNVEIYGVGIYLILIISIFSIGFVTNIISSLLLIIGYIKKNDVCILIGFFMSFILLILFIAFNWVVIFELILILVLIIILMGYIGKKIK